MHLYCFLSIRVQRERVSLFALTMRIQEAWRVKLLPWWQATLAILPTFLLTRLIFLLLTYFGTVLFTVSNYSYQVVPLRSVLRGWYHWDVISFENIAIKGYVYRDNAA